MKKIMTLILVTFATFLGAQNLIVNSSFESINSEKNIPNNWSVIKKGLFDETHSFSTTTKLEGKNAAQIVNNTGLTQGVSLYYLQNLGTKFNGLKANTKVEFSGYVRSTNGTSIARVYFESLKGKKLVLKDLEVFNDRWTKFSLFFTKEDLDYGIPYICLGLLRGNGVLFDGIYLGKENGNPYAKINVMDNFIYNGNFEIVKNSLPVKWQILNRSKGSAQLIKSKEFGNSIQLSSKDKVQKLLMWMQQVDAEYFKNLTPGTEIEVTLKAKTNSAATIFRFYVEFKAGNKFIGTFIAHNQKSSKNFQEKKFTFKVPKVTPTGVNFYLQLMSSGEVVFDDVTMKIKK